MSQIGCYNCNYEDKVSGVCKCDEMLNSPKIDENKKTVADLTVLVRRLSKQLNDVDSKNTLAGKAHNYLQKKNL